MHSFGSSSRAWYANRLSSESSSGSNSLPWLSTTLNSSTVPRESSLDGLQACREIPYSDSPGAVGVVRRDRRVQLAGDEDVVVDAPERQRQPLARGLGDARLLVATGRDAHGEGGQARE
jgi:hypothetical protein